jgi:hypothetical protein
MTSGVVLNQYFVDESGDLAFFNKRGKPLSLGENSASRFFLLGAVRIDDDMATVSDRFESLRRELLVNPFCKHIPSIKETAAEFHAKNDSAIVKNEVFKLLSGLKAEVQVLVRRKELILAQAIKTYKMTGAKRTISEKEIYHSGITRLFRNLPDAPCSITFSERGKTFTDQTLAEAIKKTRSKPSAALPETVIRKLSSKADIGLQIVDYFLWAVTQAYEHNDIDYFVLLKDKYRLIIDADDTRISETGTFYNAQNALDLAKIKIEKVSSG